MAVFHMAVKAVSRAKGQSAVAAVAYRTGTRLRCARTGTVADYTRRRGVVATRTLAPGGIVREREELWNAVEAAETRCNSTVAREFELALPAELTPGQREALALAFGQLLVERYGIVVDVAIHAPSLLGDQRNAHVHVMTSTRVLNALGQFGAKVRVLDSQVTGPVEVTALRERWASLCNEALAAAGSAARVDHRSYADTGVAALPGAKLGVASTGYERRTGEISERRLRQQAERAELEEAVARAVIRDAEAERDAESRQGEVATLRRSAPMPVRLPAAGVPLTDARHADRGDIAMRRHGRRTTSPAMLPGFIIGARARAEGESIAASGTDGAGTGEAAVPLRAMGVSRDTQRPTMGAAAARSATDGVRTAAPNPLAAVPLMLDAAKDQGVAPSPVQDAAIAQKDVVPIDPHSAAARAASPPAKSASAQHAAADDPLLRSVLGSLRAHYAAEAQAMVIAMGAATAAPQRAVADAREGGPLLGADAAVQGPAAPDARRQPAAAAHIAPDVASADAAGRWQRPDRWAARTTGILHAVGGDAFPAAEARKQARPRLRSQERAREAGAGTPVEAAVLPPARKRAAAAIPDARHGLPSHDARDGVDPSGRFDPSRRQAPPGTERHAPPQRDASAAPSRSAGSTTDRPRQVPPQQPRTPAQPSASALAEAGSRAPEHDMHGTGGSGGNAAAQPIGGTPREAPSPAPQSLKAPPPAPSCSPEDLYTACVELGAWLLRLRGDHRHEAALFAILDAARAAIPAQTRRSTASLAAAAARFRQEVARHAGALASVSVDRITRRVAMLVAATGHAELRRLFELSLQRIGRPGPSAGTLGRDAPSPDRPGKPGGRGRD